jgi:hypothetical protein
MEPCPRRRTLRSLIYPEREVSSTEIMRERSGSRAAMKRRRIGSSFCAGLLLSLFVILGSTSVAEAQMPSDALPSEPSPVTMSPLPQTTPSPTSLPSGSMKPSTTPTAKPTVVPTSSLFPSEEPSLTPSGAPSGMPTLAPTPEPTLAIPSVASAKFRQEFAVGNGRLFTPGEVVLFQGLYTGYTANFASVDEFKIETTCEVVTQVGLEGRRSLVRREKGYGRMLQTFKLVGVDFTMSYKSIYTNVTDLPIDFQSYVNQILPRIPEQMTLLGLSVTEAFVASRLIVRPEPTLAPTTSTAPSVRPTMGPTVSSVPSIIPSDFPSLVPTIFPSSRLTNGTSEAPSLMPIGKGGKGRVKDNTVIAVSVVVAGSIVLIGLLVYYRKRKLLNELEYQSNAAGGNIKNGVGLSHDEGSWNAVVQKPSSYGNAVSPETPNHISAFNKVSRSGSVPPGTSAGGMISPSESLVSNQSLLSAGNSMAGDSGDDEADATHNLADEFDQYKDQNLEKMRADVEGNLTGFDGMMSQALTRALIDDDDANVDPVELLWGGSGKLEGAEVEASALFEVTDWLKRKENASVEEK